MKFTKLLKTASFALMMCATTMTLQAADVNLTTAQNAAKSFLSKQVANGRLKAAAANNLQLVKAEASVARPTAVDYYIFNSDKSYVVIAGDDLAPEVLMYGEEGKLDMNNIPPAMQWLLNKYKYQIDGIKAGTLAPLKAPKYATTPVAPLVNANWDQSAPYNNQCPTSGSRHTLTGCPATSLSMCYYKWKWPETFPAVAAINGSTSGGVSAPALPERDADWDNIIDEYTGPTNYNYTSAQADAVAWLMRYAGQAIPDYMYGTSASGANDPEIYQGTLNMGYTDAQYLLLTELVSSGYSYGNGPQQYTDAQWNEYMLNELHNGRPIEYLAYDVSGGYSVSGHAFNVFGCNASGQYYVNWGWSGDSNGYCTLHNFTTATGATGQSGSYVFKYGEAMIIGIEPPAGALTNPRIKVSPSTLTMNTTMGTPKTATFTVTGYNLTDNVNLSMSGNNAFSMNTTSISEAQVANGVTVTVTYDPSAIGTHEATVTLTSDGAENVTVKLNGTADPTPLETYPPVMLDAGNITATSFTATWTDQTPAENMASYTLYVSDKPFKPAVALLDSTDWTSNNNIPAGWTAQGLTYYSSNSACYLSASSNGYVQTKTYDLEGYEKMTVMVYAEPYNGSNTITVATSAGSKTVNLSGSSFAWYTLVVDCASSDYVKLTTTGMPDMRYMKVYAGDLTSTQLKASETGDATYRVITGITNKSQTVTGLTQGGSFYFYVVANYTNGTIGNSNTQQVTLLETTDPTITVTPATLDLTANTGETATATFNVTGVYLTGNVRLTLTDESGAFSITPTTISAAEAMSGKDVTVTYAPTAHGSQNATITLRSTGAENVTVTLNGTATLRKFVPVMQPANQDFIKYTSFRADWTDETPAANVASYTLQVNQYGEPTLLLEETFAKCTKEGSTNIANNLNNYMDNVGWTGQNVFESMGGVRLGTSSGTGYVTSPAIDLTGGTGKISIVFNVKPYRTDKNIDVKISCGDKSQTITVNDEGEQKIVLDAAQAANQKVQIATTKNGKRVIISALRIYDEDVTEIFNAPRREAIDEQGDATTRTITGITDRFYVVNNLIGGGSYNYRVKAVYVDGTESGWSNIEHVTLKATPGDGLLGDVNNDGTVDVTDINILVNIVLGKDQASNYDGRAYINDDDTVDVTDINMVVNIVLGKDNNAQAPRKTANRYQLIKKLNKQ